MSATAAFQPHASLYANAHAHAPARAASAAAAATATAAASACASTHAIVLNWEDVLAPTTLLGQRVGLESSRQALQLAHAMLQQDVYLQQALAGIEEQAVQLLTTAAAIGPVLVVTDKSLKYMELTCAVFFPRLAAFLLQANMSSKMSLLSPALHRIQVVAAPRRFASAAERASWRASLVHNVCADLTARCSASASMSPPAFGVVAVSAADADAVTCVGVMQRCSPLALPKCVQVADPMSLSLEAFFAQLQTLQRYVCTAAAHAGAFSMHL
ncbi:hypothetical protein P43SY_001021 [Pythium insidiosum]|uniref:Uncharacterized protein n=1 Tax=Pythium insidiosum TaxID=114742 RepID=A0AAD5LV74_PYTIN|nr:hypothetical protein P43SY_001021 [Pythium insidiosum]